MEYIEQYIDGLHERAISEQFDRVIPVIGDEGMGKSTFMLEFAVLWKRKTGQDVVIDKLLDQIVWSLGDFQETMSAAPPRAVIPVPDAGRILHRKEAMKSEHVQLEKDFLDVRARENVILLGYQSWDIVPSFLQKRRAKNAFRILRRGDVAGYNRVQLDKRLENDRWPDETFRDTFPDLEGTELWRRYKQRDMEEKEARMGAQQEADPDDARRQEAIKAVIRGVRPWDDEGGMTYREAAKLTDYSRGWVSDRMQEWKDGEHRELIDTKEAGIA
jgi:energy-coupling factor transporter ATP-binding protein EcfA2